MVMPNRAPGSRLDAFYAAEAAYLAGGLGDPEAREAFRACFTPDVVVREPESLPYGGEWHGHDGVERLMARLREVYDEAGFADRETYECGDTVFMLMRSRVRSRRTGRRMTNSVLQRIELRGGLIAAMEIFHWDPLAIRQLCDPAAEPTGA
jgi:ketosteroid isomerase-like protein